MTKDFTLFKKHFRIKKNFGFIFCEWEGPEWYIFPTIALIIKSPILPDSIHSKISFSIEWLRGVFWVEFTFKHKLFKL